MTPLETYLRELRDIRSLGAAVDETAYYSALANLLTDAGKKLKVRCIMGLKDLGAGFPDGGLFTDEQFDKKHTLRPLPGQLPSRGVIEVKPVKNEAWVTAEGEQVSRYWGKYRQVLVTNYRDFVLVGQDAEGKFAKLESFHLADSEKAFWAAAAHPRSLAEKIGARFEEYLLRVMRHAAQLVAPEDVAWFLASYARDARARIQHVDLPALATVRTALEEALGLKFEGEKGEHFFRSSLVQTLFYGVFSAWVLWAKQNPPASKARFDWYTTARYLRVPMISKLFHLVADPQELEALKLTEVLDWAGMVLKRVDRRSFFDKFQESHAVQYFYEPFLEAFDPELRKELGVWYTPPEIVKYMVERVDTVLREELNLPGGLANKNVYVLDPCCGTGSYLVEVLDRIHRTLKERGEDALTASDLKEAAQKRVFGFEILPAPFVVSHLQLGLLLQNLGAPLSEKPKERVGVYLTNALTGWEPPKGPKQRLIFPELEEERDAAEHVKREVPILVILGNPPYNAFAGVSPDEEQGLVEPYKEGLISEWDIKKFNLDDFYVRFFRLAERRITQGQPGKGIVCYISNFSYLSDPSFVVMRSRFLSEFDKLWIDCMNGDSRETGKVTPKGKPDPSVFSTERNREGIRVGTAIALMVRKGSGGPAPTIRFRHFWGATKRVDLVGSLNSKDFSASYDLANPGLTNRYSFRPHEVTAGYLTWPGLDEFAELGPTLGILENRKDALTSIDREPLEERMRAYLDRSLEWETIKGLVGGLAQDAARFDAKKARTKVLANEAFRPQAIRRMMLRPMDERLCYYSSTRPVWNEPRPTYVEQCWAGNAAFVSRRKGVANPEGVPFFFVSCVGNQHAFLKDAYYVPLQLKPKSLLEKGQKQKHLVSGEEITKANLSHALRAYLKRIGIDNPDADTETASLIWMHALAIGYSPAYISENADGIRQDWPRIPLPNSEEVLLASAKLGKRVAELLDPEDDASLVNLPLLNEIAVPSRVGGGSLHDDDLSITVGWGHGGDGSPTMPGKGKILERAFAPSERADVERARGVFTPSARQELPAEGDLITLYRAFTAEGFEKFKLSGEIAMVQHGARGATSDLRTAQDYARLRGLGARIIKFVTQLDSSWIMASSSDPGEYRIRAPFRPLSWEEVPVEEVSVKLAEPEMTLGSSTCDVYLNQNAYWKNIPIRVWEYSIGGYQVMKKWLSYREEKLLGRSLSKDEVRYVQEMARRIAAIILLEPALDANYQNVKAHTFPWKAST